MISKQLSKRGENIWSPAIQEKETSEFKKGSIFNIVKEPDNPYDMEAIAVKSDNITIAYVANSVRTVVKGTMSAGRIYDKFGEDCEIEVIFVRDQIIAKLIFD